MFSISPTSQFFPYTLTKIPKSILKCKNYGDPKEFTPLLSYILRHKLLKFHQSLAR